AAAVRQVDTRRAGPGRERYERQRQPQVTKAAAVRVHGKLLACDAGERVRPGAACLKVSSARKDERGGTTLATAAWYRSATHSRSAKMPRHANYLPHGVIPAVLLTFSDDLSIDERSFRSHLRDVAATKGLSAVTVNAHSTEVASCSFEEQRRVLEIAQEEIGDRLPLVSGIWADGSMEAAHIARMAAAGGASALLVFPPAPFRSEEHTSELQSLAYLVCRLLLE